MADSKNRPISQPNDWLIRFQIDRLSVYQPGLRWIQSPLQIDHLDS